MSGGPPILDVLAMGGIAAEAEAISLGAQEHPANADALLTDLSDLNALWGRLTPLVLAYPDLDAYAAIHPPRLALGQTHMDRLRQFAAMENAYRLLNRASAIVNAIYARATGPRTEGDWP